MGFFQLPNLPLTPFGGEGVIVGEDGAVHVIFGRTTDITLGHTYVATFRPSATGSYEDGAWDTDVPTIDQYHRGAKLWKDSAGNINVVGGHAQDPQPGPFLSATWRMRDSGWVASGDISNHNGGGNVVHVGAGQNVVFQTTSAQRIDRYPLTGAQISTPSPAHNVAESGYCLLPDGRFFAIEQAFGAYNTINAVFATITFDGDGRPNGVTYEVETMNLVIDSLRGRLHRHPNRPSSSGLTLNETVHTIQENFQPVYSPAVDRVLAISAMGGEMFSIDVNQSPPVMTWEATLPVGTIDRTPYNRVGYVDASTTGSTVDALLGSGNDLIVAADALVDAAAINTHNNPGQGPITALGGSGTVVISTADASAWCAVEADPANITIGGDGTWIGSSNLINFGPVTYVGGDRFIGITGARVSLYVPAQTARESGPLLTPSGHVVIHAGADNLFWPGTGDVFIWDGASTVTTIHEVSDPFDTSNTPWQVAAWKGQGALLPTGQIFRFAGRFAYLHTIDAPHNVIDPTHRPTITSAPTTARPGETVRIVGTQIHGRHEGGHSGDENTQTGNYPFAKLASGSRVYYRNGYNWSNWTIAANAPGEFDIIIPVDIVPGTYDLSIIANGIESTGTPRTITISAAAGVPSTILEAY